jgi:hypothetical protein
MKVHLMHRDRDFDLEQALPPQVEDLTQDLELDRVLDAMAAGDDYLRKVAGVAVVSGLQDAGAIVYRQEILRDCLAQPDVVRAIYDLAVEAIQGERTVYVGLFRDSPSQVLLRSVRVLELFAERLRRLRELADEHAGDFASDGFVTLFRMLRAELADAYLERVDEHLERLRFRHGTLISAELGAGNRGVDYVLRRMGEIGWRERLGLRSRSSLRYQVPDRDESGFRALAALEARGVNLVANALAQSTDHILAFFRMLRCELGFYVGCLNLHRRLDATGEPLCFPVPSDGPEPALSCRGLYDVSLRLSVRERVVGNDVAADGRALVMITGANQGGKSTFLRSVGLAQLMLQCGMFVGAEAFTADLRHGVFTHFRREEDATMTSGKLDEELSRMSDIVDAMGPRAMLLCNESFAATNEREGSEIARQIIRALVQQGVKILFVTHMYDLAHGIYTAGGDAVLFLRAEREADGNRTFRLGEGEPLPTSHGEDLYRRIFGSSPDAAGVR